MIRSEKIDIIAKALAEAQLEIEPVEKNATNLYYGRQYVTLTGCYQACRQVLAAHGIAIIQTPIETESGLIAVETTLVHHASGQAIGGVVELPIKSQDPQAAGSAITYARRYGLMTLVGMSPEDDDGNKATRPAEEPSKKATIKPENAKATATTFVIKLQGADNTKDLERLASEIAQYDLPDDLKEELRVKYMERIKQIGEAK